MLATRPRPPKLKVTPYVGVAWAPLVLPHWAPQYAPLHRKPRAVPSPRSSGGPNDGCEHRPQSYSQLAPTAHPSSLKGRFVLSAFDQKAQEIALAVTLESPSTAKSWAGLGRTPSSLASLRQKPKIQASLQCPGEPVRGRRSACSPAPTPARCSRWASEALWEAAASLGYVHSAHVPARARGRAAGPAMGWWWTLLRVLSCPGSTKGPGSHPEPGRRKDAPQPWSSTGAEPRLHQPMWLRKWGGKARLERWQGRAECTAPAAWMSVQGHPWRQAGKDRPTRGPGDSYLLRHLRLGGKQGLSPELGFQSHTPAILTASKLKAAAPILQSQHLPGPANNLGQLRSPGNG